MQKPRIVVVDDDFSYIAPLQAKFIYEYHDSVDIEIITDNDYLVTFLDDMQKIDVMIISQDLYTEEIRKHEISHIFVLTETQESDLSTFENIHTIYKYTSVKGVFLEIVGISNLNIPVKEGDNDPKIIFITSASGGVGKTTIALGLAAALSDMYKKVLYIEAARLQSFQQHMDDSSPILNQGTYTKMSNPTRRIYQEIKDELRKQNFFYLPPLKAALMSFGIEYHIYGMIAKAAKESSEYDYIIVDADTIFDEAKAKMINVSDRVIIVSESTKNSAFATNQLVSNINNSSSEKYLFVCNKFLKEKKEAFSGADSIQLRIDEYVERFDEYEDMSVEDFGRQNSIRNIAFLLI